MPSAPDYTAEPNTFDWDAAAADLALVLLPELIAAAMLGLVGFWYWLRTHDLATAADRLAAVDMATWATTWAQDYTAQLADELTQTTRQQVTETLRQAAGTAEDRDSTVRRILQGLLALLLGRAAMIAATEITRARTEAQLFGADAAGLPTTTPTVKPPLHPNCRCVLRPFLRRDGVLSWRWQTAEDERVCPQCAPLHDQDVGA